MSKKQNQKVKSVLEIIMAALTTASTINDLIGDDTGKNKPNKKTSAPKKSRQSDAKTSSGSGNTIP